MIKSLLCAIIISTLSGSVFAQENELTTLGSESKLNEVLAFLYRQSKFALRDPEGDQALLLRVKRSSKNIIRHLMNIESPKNPGVSYDEDGAPLGETPPEIDIEGSEKPIHTDAFVAMIQQVIFEESLAGITPSVGEFHKWSRETKFRHPFSPTLRFTKILTALALGVSSRVLITEKEPLLKEFLLGQEDSSVTVEQIFRKSYQLNNGNVYLSLLTIENLLSANWKAPNRDRIPFIMKLKPIHSHFGKGGDKYGFWYHLFGTFLYGYVRGRFIAQWVGGVEAVGSKILAKFEYEKQETYANFLGGKIGAQLRRQIEKIQKHGSFLSFQPSKDHLKEDSYLHKTEDFRDRMPLPVSFLFAAYANSIDKGAAIYLRYFGKEELGLCDLNVFVFPGLYKNRGQLITLTAVDFTKDQGVFIKTRSSQMPIRLAIYITNPLTCLPANSLMPEAFSIPVN